jgi:hypothetical protein
LPAIFRKEILISESLSDSLINISFLKIAGKQGKRHISFPGLQRDFFLCLGFLGDNLVLDLIAYYSVLQFIRGHLLMLDR